jgi:hypothetical protein
LRAEREEEKGGRREREEEEREEREEKGKKRAMDRKMSVVWGTADGSVVCKKWDGIVKVSRPEKVREV